MTKKFFKHTKKVLVINENYTNWLIDYLRKQNQKKGWLATGYFNQNSANLNLAHTDDKKFIVIIKLNHIIFYITL